MRRTGLLSAVMLALTMSVCTAQGRGLDIYFIDTEGGAATLIVTPAGESLLIDAGNPGERDASRIHKVAAQQAGLKQIDHFLVTHWHLDHYGGIGPLSKLMPVKTFHDKGIPAESIDDKENFPRLIAAYRAAGGDKSETLKPGTLIKLQQAEGSPRLQLRTVIANQQPVPDRAGARPNPLAAEHMDKEPDHSDNANSAGFILSFGDFRFHDFGDLTHNTEAKLIAPSNKIGTADVYQVTHHGLNISNNPALVKSIKPTVAIFNNGARKGGHPDVVRTLREVKELRAIYQLHRNVTSAADQQTTPDKIANMEENCQAQFIKLSVAPDGKSYTVQIGPDGKKETYACKTRPAPRAR
jgi:beta-lactamase superfamily II metal-dependent hydrolase